MTCPFLSLCVSPTEEPPILRVAIHGRTVVYPTAIWRGEREEKRPFCLELLFMGATKLSAIMEMAVLWSVRTSGMISTRMSVVYRRMQVDHSVIFDSLTLQLLQSMIWYEVLEYTDYHVDYWLHLHRQLIDRNKKKREKKKKQNIPVSTRLR